MNSKRNMHLFLHGGHVSDDQLLMYLDGAVPVRQASSIRGHLQDCWSCRVRCENIQRAISDYVQYCQDSVPEPNRDLSAQFAARLRQLSDDRAQMRRSVRNVLSSALRLQLWPVAPRWVFGLPAILSILIIWTRIEFAPTVSAMEVLSRSESAEADRVQTVPDAIVYQKLAIVRKAAGKTSSESAKLEVWNDASGRRHKKQPDDGNGISHVPSGGEAESAAGKPAGPGSMPQLVADLVQVYRKNKMNDLQFLSAGGYLAWRNSIRVASEEVLETSSAAGTKALALSVTAEGPYENDEIVRATLLVQASSWHPIETRLQVQDANGPLDYQVTETDYRVFPASTLSSSFFDEKSLPQPEIMRVAQPGLLPVPVSAEAAMAAEIEADYALHRLHVCLGEPISVSRNETNQIEVRGLAATAERKEQVMEALKTVPGVRVEIATLEESARQGNRGRQRSGEEMKFPESQAAGRAREVEAAKLPFQNQLEKYIAESMAAEASNPGTGTGMGNSLEQKVLDFSREAIDLSERVRAEAWALRRLAEKYAGTDADSLDANSWRLLNEMIRDHLRALSAQTHQARRLIEPPLSEFARAGASEGSDLALGTGRRKEWTDQALALSSLCDRADRWVAVVFAGVDLPSITPEEAAGKLLQALPALEQEIATLNQDLDRVPPRKLSPAAQRR